jgi:hypothetical protein
VNSKPPRPSDRSPVCALSEAYPSVAVARPGRTGRLPVSRRERPFVRGLREDADRLSERGTGPRSETRAGGCLRVGRSPRVYAPIPDEARAGKSSPNFDGNQVRVGGGDAKLI